MGLDRAKLFVAKIGEWNVASGATFYAGGPLQAQAYGELEASGAGLLECTDVKGYVGFALQDSEDTTTNTKVAFYTGTCIVTLKVSTLNDATTAYPFDNARTYRIGDKIYLNETTSKWTNDTVGKSYSTNFQEKGLGPWLTMHPSGAYQFGTVLEAPDAGSTTAWITVLFRP